MAIDLSKISDSSEKDLSVADNLEFPEIEIDEIHKLDRPILFRHFVEGLVRVAFIRYSNGGVLSLENTKVPEGDLEITRERPKS
jgi:hypothetical protein